jgi:DNA-binding MarR family transcriptional regulator
MQSFAIIVGAIMEPGAAQGWETPRLRVDLGRALLRETQPRTSRQLAEVISADQSNVKKEADRLADAGLVTRSAAPPTAGRGRRPRSAYSLSKSQRDIATVAINDRRDPDPRRFGQLRRGQDIILATVDSAHITDLLHVLAETQAVGHALWIAQCGQEMILAFDAIDNADPALELLANLDAARVPSRRGTVTRVESVDDIVARAQALVGQARRTRLVRDTRRASSSRPD